MSNYRKFTKEEQAKARNVDILTLAEQHGYSFQKQGRYFRCNEHDSMIIKDQSYAWNSQDKKGYGAITFSTDVLDVKFQDAMKMLVDGEYEPHKISKEEAKNTKAFNYNSNEEPNDKTKSRSYLIDERQLDPKLVDWAYKTGVVSQDNRNNVVFKWINENNEVVGADKRGTGIKPFKQVVQGSEENSGFHIDINQDKFKGIEKVVFTESPIDALSYYDAHHDIQQTRIASLSGLKENNFIGHLKNVSKHHEENGTVPNKESVEFVLAVDNDNAGKNFVKNMLNKYEGNFKLDLPADRKDWNEQLKKDKAITNGEPTYEKSQPIKEPTQKIHNNKDSEMER